MGRFQPNLREQEKPSLPNGLADDFPLLNEVLFGDAKKFTSDNNSTVVISFSRTPPLVILTCKVHGIKCYLTFGSDFLRSLCVELEHLVSDKSLVWQPITEVDNRNGVRR